MSSAKKFRKMHKCKSRVKARKENAAIILAHRSQRTPAQQLARLDEMLGQGQGAKKERARLTASLS